MYSLITSGMTWSYSRITSFERCPYQFFLTYIRPQTQAPMFFSDYGSLVHEILGLFYEGKLKKEELVSSYLTNFFHRVRGRAPSSAVYQNYLQQGVDCLKAVQRPEEKILGVEQRVEFSVGDLPFVGFVDLILQDADGRLTICDHKSRALKPRSKSGKHTKSDEELDRYLRQLYLYSIPVTEQYGRKPDFLQFHCYRVGRTIREPFREPAFEDAKAWALETVQKINSETEWKPCIDYYRCRNLCGFHSFCEYYSLQ